MRPTPILVLLAAPALVAQTPSPEPTVGQRLRTERPEIERLLADSQPREALKRAEALLPATAPAFDNTDARTQVQSHLNHLALSQAYYLAFKAADASGHWERALEHIRKAQETAAANHAAVKDAFPKVSENFKASGLRSQAVLTEHAEMIKELRTKVNLDPGEKQTLDGAALEEKNIVEAQKWSKVFLGYAEAAREDAERYKPYVAAEESRIKGQEAQIAEYKAGKGEKTKWVEAIIANPSTYSSISEKRDLLSFLYRLNALDPENKKVLRQIDVVLGKAAPAPAKKAVKTKAK